MRRVASAFLFFVGAFLLTVALLALLWAPGQVKKTPIDVNSVTRLSGEAAIADGTGGTTSTPVKATSTTHADSALSSSDVVLFQNSSCLMKDPDGDAPDCVSAEDPDGRLLSASTDSFATDRRTATAVNDYENLPVDSSEKEGLINKFPFDVEQITYPFWDGYIGKAVDAVFDGTEEIEGLETYRFQISVPDTVFELLPGEDGTYTTEKTMWVDPVTGSIIKQSEHQVRRMVNGDTFLDLDFEFTPETVTANVESAKDNASRLGLLTSRVPLIAGLLGLLALVGAIVLFLSRRGDRDAAVVDHTDPVYEEPVYEEQVYEDRTDQFFEEADGSNSQTRRPNA